VTTFHVPEVTDQMLEKCLEAAASPVAVLFQGGSEFRQHKVMKVFRETAREFDDRVIFVWIRARENPEFTQRRCLFPDDMPCLQVYRGGLLKHSVGGVNLADGLRRIVEEQLNRHNQVHDDEKE
jgi:hypothetical protein